MKNIAIEIKWALIFILVMIVWMFIEKSVGLHDTYIDMHPIFTNLFAIPSFIIYFIALNEKKNKFYNGKMNWKQGFKTGVIISALVALVSPLSQYIISTYITPDYFKNVIAYAVRTNHMTQPDAEAYFNLKNYIAQGIFGSIVMGTITSAIVAFFVKTKTVTT